MTENAKKKYDLEDRTAFFGEEIIRFCKTVKGNTINTPLVSQIVRSATSVGANYMEANGASSKKDFANKISICRKEAQETRHWLRMLAVAEEGRKEDIGKLWKECQELVLIFGKISASTRNSIP
jgi:four helix bundle protein